MRFLEEMSGGGIPKDNLQSFAFQIWATSSVRYLEIREVQESKYRGSVATRWHSPVYRCVFKMEISPLLIRVPQLVGHYGLQATCLRLSG